MYVWNNGTKKFDACPKHWLNNYEPKHNFTGKVVSNNGGNAVFSKGILIQFDALIEDFLPEIVVGLSEGKKNDINWKIMGNIYEESINIRTKEPDFSSN